MPIVHVNILKMPEQALMKGGRDPDYVPERTGRYRWSFSQGMTLNSDKPYSTSNLNLRVACLS